MACHPFTNSHQYLRQKARKVSGEMGSTRETMFASWSMVTTALLLSQITTAKPAVRTKPTICLGLILPEPSVIPIHPVGFNLLAQAIYERASN